MLVPRIDFQTIHTKKNSKKGIAPIMRQIELLNMHSYQLPTWKTLSYYSYILYQILILCVLFFQGRAVQCT